MSPALRQTRTHISELLIRRGLSPRHDLGQNFLIDLNLLEFLVAEADLGPEDVVLEVGSGTGGLTAFLAERAGAVIAVEIDPRLREFTKEAVAGFTNVTLLGCDVLKNKNHLAEAVQDALGAALADSSRRLKLVANLPYCVATPVISNLIASGYRWERMVVTIQLELAQRMAATERTSDYSALSVWLQSQCRIELLKKLPASVFWPRPKVESAMIRITPDPERRAVIRDRKFLHTFLRDLFQQRRKVLRKVLGEMFREQLGPDVRARIAEALRSLGLGETARAEEISPADLIALSNGFYEIIEQSRGGDGKSSPDA